MYKLQGKVSRKDSEGNPLEFDFTNRDIQQLAKQAGYTGPKQFASSYLQGYRDARGNISVNSQDGGGQRSPAVNAVLQQYGLAQTPRLFQNELQTLGERDPQVGGTLTQWANNRRDIFDTFDQYGGVIIGAGMLGAGLAAGGAIGGGLSGGASGGGVVGAGGGGELAGGLEFMGGASGGEIAGVGGAMDGFFDDILGDIGLDDIVDAGKSFFSDDNPLMKLVPSGDDWLARTLALAPSLAAIDYAKGQKPFDTSGLNRLYRGVDTDFDFNTNKLDNLYKNIDTSFNLDTRGVRNVLGDVPRSFDLDTSRLEGIFDQFDPQSVTGQYDIQTGQGRGALADSLASRGVTGSSFANADFANYGMARDVGRQSLINDALMKQGGVASSILGAEQAEQSLGLQGLGLRGQLSTSLLDASRAEADLGLRGQALRGNIAGMLLDSDKSAAALNLQGQTLQGNILSQILNSDVQSRKLKNDLYGRALMALSGGLMPRGGF